MDELSAYERNQCSEYDQNVGYIFGKILIVVATVEQF